MTREEAIELLDNLTGMVEDNQNSDYDTALKMAIKALEQEPCVDAVSRANLLKKFEDRFIELQKAHKKDRQLGVNWCINTLKDMPPVTPTRKYSEWQQDHAILKAHSDGANEVLDRIKKARNEVANYSDFHREHLYKTNPNYDVEQGQYLAYEKCLQIIDNLIAEVEG